MENLFGAAENKKEAGFGYFMRLVLRLKMVAKSQ
jgi:hypothetical protein